MKKCFFIVVLIVNCSCAVKVHELAIPDTIQTFGRIRTFISTSFDVRDKANDTVKKIKSRIKAFYNRDGKLLYQLDCNYLKNSVSIDSTSYVYSDKKLLMRSVTSSNYDDDVLQQNYVYNKKNQLIATISTRNDKLDITIKKTYDKKGNTLTRTLYDKDNNIKYIDSFLYNYKSRYYEVMSGITLKKGNYRTYFNKMGQLCRIEEYASNSKLKTYSEHYFDFYQNRIGSTNFDFDGKPKSIYKSIFVYDDKGNWLKKSGFSNGKLVEYSENTVTYW